MGDIDGVDIVKRGDSTGETEECVESEQSRPEENGISMTDQSSLVEMNGSMSPLGENESLQSAADVSEIHQASGESDQAIRKGSANSRRSRHGSGGSAGSRRSRSRSRHKSKHADETGDGTSRRRSNSRTRSNSDGKHHSRNKSKSRAKTETVDSSMSVDRENASSAEEEDNAEQNASSGREGQDKDQKRIAKMGKKLVLEKERYLAEKQQLREKMKKARQKVQEEITQYKTELDGKRQEYLTKLSDLQLDDQHAALDQRMDELAEVRDELDSRFQHCVQYEKEIEEIERYLDRRQQLCNSKEEDLRHLDDQLDMLHQELELDKERLERAGFDVANIGPRSRASSFKTSQVTERDEDDYILKTNLRKCQNELKKAEQTVHEKETELAEAKEEISSLQSQRKKHKEKIKQLETQLSIALSQLKDHTNSTHSSPPTLNRQASVRSHVTLDRFKSPTDLSINQQAQLNRSLLGKDRGGIPPAGKKYMSSSSFTVNSFPKSDSDNSKGSSDGAPMDGYTQEFVTRPRSSTEGSDAQTKTVSSTCVVM